MKNFLKNNGLWVLFAAAVIAVALALMSVFSNTSSPLTNLANTIASPFRSAYTAVAEWFNDKQKYYQDYTGLEEENARLRQQIASMEAEIRQARDDSAENERLKELLGLQEERPDLTEDIVLATITEHAVTNWAATLTISRGTNDGLEVGDCVMGENRLRLDYLPADCDLLGGDLVVTSGLGGFFPAGLVIGSVEELQMDDSGASSYAILAPAVDFSSLQQVVVIRSFDASN